MSQITLFSAIFTLFVSSQPALAAGHGSPLFYENLKDERAVPFISQPGEISRLKMIAEMGRKHGLVDCSSQCANATGVRKQACQLGLLGATYLLTGLQYQTHRSTMEIWRTPNTSLTVGAYAFMKERERGIRCEQSEFIKRFPTRRPAPGEARPPISHVDVCQAWNAYFAVTAPPRIPLAYVEEQEPVYVDHAQELLWKAHTTALLHNYYQYRFLLRRHDLPGVPIEEYKAWMGWNLIVGNWVPRQNYNSCVAGADFFMSQLLPNCIRGQKMADGSQCKGTLPKTGSLYKRAEGIGFGAALNWYKTDDFDQVIDVFAKGRNAH